MSKGWGRDVKEMCKGCARYEEGVRKKRARDVQRVCNGRERGMHGCARGEEGMRKGCARGV